MTAIQALILGIVQGITEFFPISSSGHLILIPYIFGWELQDLKFDVALHLGTALAVLLFFWKDWYDMVVALLADAKIAIVSEKFYANTLRRETKLLLTIIAVSLPVGIAGVLLEDTIESTFRSSLFVGVMLIVVAFIMYAADRFAKSSSQSLESDIFKIPFRKALLISLSQILALFPGTSRSGISISTALFNKIEYKEAARFSFLLATPLIIGAGIIKLPDILVASEGIIPLLVGFFTSFLTGILSIKILLNFLKKHGLLIFVIYRIALGIAILVL
jgi:undecaprenyl-diphosphatase